MGDRPLPVSLLTGFLGSGKTTVLRHVLALPGMARTAVIVNELGEVGLDHHLIGTTVADNTVLLDNGCLCCAMKDDLIRTLRQLYMRRYAGEVPPFERVVIETTGLADPASIIHSLLTDQLLADCFRLDGVLATVDGVTGMATLEAYAEAVKQAAMADRLLLTKSDLVSDAEEAALRARLHDLNPGAPIITVVEGVVSPEQLFNAGYYNPETKTADVRRWLAAEAYQQTDEDHHHHDHDHEGHGDALDRPRHQREIASFCVTLEEPLDWRDFVIRLRKLIATHGSKLLRIKGIVNVMGRDAPIVIHGVQHLLHPPVALEAWPDADHRSRIVFITRALDPEAVRQALAA